MLDGVSGGKGYGGRGECKDSVYGHWLWKDCQGGSLGWLGQRGRLEEVSLALATAGDPVWFQD